MQNTITTKDFGPSPDRITVTMKTVITREGIAITTTAGGTYNSLLSRTFPFPNGATATDVEQVTASARTFYGHIKDCAKAGKGTWQIEAEIAALIEMEQAVDVEAVKDGINADWDARQAETVAVHNRNVQAVDEIMQGADYATWRRKVRAQAIAEATSSVVQAQNEPAPLDRIIREAAANGGVIIRSGLAKSTQILALAKDRLAVPTYEYVWERGHSVKRLSGAALTDKGLRRAAELNEEIAA